MAELPDRPVRGFMSTTSYLNRRRFLAHAIALGGLPAAVPEQLSGCIRSESGGFSLVRVIQGSGEPASRLLIEDRR